MKALMKNAFYFILEFQKLFSFLIYLIFSLDFLIMYKKLLDYEYKVSFKNYDVTTWLTNNSDTDVVQYHTKQRQLDNKIWSVNRI